MLIIFRIEILQRSVPLPILKFLLCKIFKINACSPTIRVSPMQKMRLTSLLPHSNRLYQQQRQTVTIWPAENVISAPASASMETSFCWIAIARCVIIVLPWMSTNNEQQQSDYSVRLVVFVDLCGRWSANWKWFTLSVCPFCRSSIKHNDLANLRLTPEEIRSIQSYQQGKLFELEHALHFTKQQDNQVGIYLKPLDDSCNDLIRLDRLPTILMKMLISMSISI